MRKKYRSDILAFLSKWAPEPANLLPFVQGKMDDNVFSRLLFMLVLESLKDDGLIEYEDYGDEIKAHLLPKGIAELERMKQRETIKA